MHRVTPPSYDKNSIASPCGEETVNITHLPLLFGRKMSRAVGRGFLSTSNRAIDHVEALLL